MKKPRTRVGNCKFVSHVVTIAFFPFNGATESAAWLPAWREEKHRKVKLGNRKVLSVTRSVPQQGEVLAHYQKMAVDYNQRANRTCESVYHRLVNRFMKGKSRLLELAPAVVRCSNRSEARCPSPAIWPGRCS